MSWIKIVCDRCGQDTGSEYNDNLIVRGDTRSVICSECGAKSFVGCPSCHTLMAERSVALSQLAIADRLAEAVLTPKKHWWELEAIATEYLEGKGK